MNKQTKLVLSIVSLTAACGIVFAMDTFFGSFTLRVFNLCAIYIILALSMNLLNGFTGLFSLGHAGFMAIGAYVCALLTLTPEQKQVNFFLEPIVPWLAHLTIPFVPALLAAGAVAALLGFVVGAPVLRL